MAEIIAEDLSKCEVKMIFSLNMSIILKQIQEFSIRLLILNKTFIENQC